MITPRLALACAAIAITSLPFVMATAGCDHRRGRPRHPPATQPGSPQMVDDGRAGGDAGQVSPEPTFTAQPGDIHI